MGFLSRVQVAVKIIDKTQLNSSSLQKVSGRPLPPWHLLLSPWLKLSGHSLPPALAGLAPATGTPRAGCLSDLLLRCYLLALGQPVHAVPRHHQERIPRPAGRRAGHRKHRDRRREPARPLPAAVESGHGRRAVKTTLATPVAGRADDRQALPAPPHFQSSWLKSQITCHEAGLPLRAESQREPGSH